MVTLQLLSVIVVHFKGYGRPFITKDLIWHTRTSSGPKLPARLMTSYGYYGWEDMDHPYYSLILHTVISISLDPFRSIWQANTWQQKPTWSALSPSGYKDFTPTCLWQDASLATVEQIVVHHWFLCGYLMTTICYLCAMYTLKSEQTPWHQSVRSVQNAEPNLTSKGMQHLSLTTESWNGDLLSQGMCSTVYNWTCFIFLNIKTTNFCTQLWQLTSSPKRTMNYTWNLF
jgi:hypothetical protein